jgi:hypothetical protein
VDDGGIEWSEQVSGNLRLLVSANVNALLFEAFSNLGGGGDVLW